MTSATFSTGFSVLATRRMSARWSPSAACFPVGTVAGGGVVTSGGVDAAYAAISLGAAPFTFLARIDLGTGHAAVLSVAASPYTLRGLAAYACPSHARARPRSQAGVTDLPPFHAPGPGEVGAEADLWSQAARSASGPGWSRWPTRFTSGREPLAVNTCA